EAKVKWRSVELLEESVGKGHSRLGRQAAESARLASARVQFKLLQGPQLTCNQANHRIEPLEFIEMSSVLLLQAKVLCHVVDTLNIFHCRTIINPELTMFCTELTGITQSQVDEAMVFPKSLSRRRRLAARAGALRQRGQEQRWEAKLQLRWTVVTWSDADCLSAALTNCAALGLPVPGCFKQWINLTVLYRQLFRCDPPDGGLQAVVEALGHAFDGSCVMSLV
ncbi:unnamed protein product, partial [Phaeothamnion confervicola]